MLEWLAFTFALLQVILAYYNKSQNFIFGAISVTIYSYLFFKVNLLGEGILNFYYLFISIYGILHWSNKANEPKIGFATRRDYSWTFLILTMTFMAMLMLYYLRQKHLIPINFLDSLVAASAFGGSFLLLKRKVENWLVLNFSNIIAIPLQIHKELMLTALLTILFFIIAVLGYRKWRKILNVTAYSQK